MLKGGGDGGSDGPIVVVGSDTIVDVRARRMPCILAEEETARTFDAAVVVVIGTHEYRVVEVWT